jgi:pimeloyl-ACP methyl ester carboxylesterase
VALLALACTLLLAPASALATAPSLAWNTFPGGVGQFDGANAVATDDAGNIDVAGDSDAGWGSPVNPYGSGTEAFVAKLSPSGALLWHTFLGAGDSDTAHALVVGAGGTAHSWDAHQLPYFRDAFRNTTSDCRGAGTTTCETPPPWPIEAFARDIADLTEAVCDPPVALVGHSFGTGIAQQVALDLPDLLRCAIAMGTGARSVGWTWDY